MDAADSVATQSPRSSPASMEVWSGARRPGFRRRSRLTKGFTLVFERSEQLAHEQNYVTTAYARLDDLRASARERLADVRRHGPSGSPQNRSERDAFATLYEDRVAQLEAVEDRLCFGRLDLEDSLTRYIGRIGLSDAEHTPILTDWRAPAARPFYQATANHREGVVRRRHILTQGRSVTEIEDDVLDVEALADEEVAALSGEGALLAALNAQRTGQMTDIVATIQAEQDVIIREDLTGVLVVQGGPGTGKTAVALHRAAYLLYAHRARLERTGVLFVGPNLRFLRYIDQVLPSLGETGAVTARLADLMPGITADALESSDLAAEVKGRTVWTRILERAVSQRERVPDSDVVIELDGRTMVLERRAFVRARDAARRSRKPHNLARVGFVHQLISNLCELYIAQLGYDVPADERSEIDRELRSLRDVRVALNLAWMPLTPQKLLEDLFSSPARLAAAAPELSEAERASLIREKGSAWTEADVPLLDEAAELLGEDDQAARQQARQDSEQRAAELAYARDVLESIGPAENSRVSAETLAGRFSDSGSYLTTAERASADRTWAYGHIVVDEAQELSPMAWRLLMRRCPSRSMTIVGDVAQTSAPGGTHAWAERLDPLFRGHWRLRELTVNYRTPAQVMDLAGEVARAAGLGAKTPRSVRETDQPIDIISAHGLDTRMQSGENSETAALMDSLEVAIERAKARVAQAGGGTIAVVVPRGLRAEAARRWPEDARFAVLTPRGSKGLEFDVVVLAEPAEILLERSGASDLYVAMTRPTQALFVVHSEPLPQGFEAQVSAGLDSGREG